MMPMAPSSAAGPAAARPQSGRHALGTRGSRCLRGTWRRPGV